MSDLDIEYRIAKMQLCPGDVLVVKLDVGALSQDMQARAVDYFRAHVPNGVQFMVIDRGVQLSILTADEIKKRVSA